ncbi:MAG TPA: hypothetical protein PLL06_19055, partial [Acidobacteriota bacterium]|nr:hypothetical protein [Acidobacteriota bacterium]
MKPLCRRGLQVTGQWMLLIVIGVWCVGVQDPVWAQKKQKGGPKPKPAASKPTTSKPVASKPVTPQPPKDIKLMTDAEADKEMDRIDKEAEKKVKLIEADYDRRIAKAEKIRDEEAREQAIADLEVEQED